MQSDETILQNAVRWGILSAANIGVNHVAPAIHASSNGSLVAVGSRNPDRARALFAFAPEIAVYDDYESVINDPAIEAIYNPLPNSLHAEWTIRALQAGKHVLCEKPLAVTAEQGAMMAQVSRETGNLLMEAFMYRFHPQTVWVLEQIANGRIGDVKLVHSSFSFNISSRPRDIRLRAALAGGSLMDVGCYPINVCRAIYGRMPLAVGARVFVPDESEVERSANAVLDFGNGCFGLIDCSFDLPARQVTEIIGDAGAITIRVPFSSAHSEATVLVSTEGQEVDQHFAPFDQYRLEVEHFAACIRLARFPILSLDETIENLATIEAIYQSAGYSWPRA
ncbi:MAG: Gfo/Idh/MocA family oxidoreductase [Ktedonobacteraceae bacterium]